MRTAIYRSLGAAAAAAAFFSAIALLFPQRSLWVDLTAVALISIAATFPLQLTLSRRKEALDDADTKFKSAIRHEPVADRLSAIELVDSGERALDRRHMDTAESPDGIMLLLTIDNFDNISERYGGEWADTLLLSIMQIVYASVRFGDLVARVATGELGIYLPGANRDNASDICERIRLRIRETTFAAGQERPIDVTVRFAGTRYGHQAGFQIIHEAANRAALAEEEAGSILFRERFS